MSKRKASRTDMKYAGNVDGVDYGVVTLVSDADGDHAHCLRPCASCPWRKDLPVGAFPPDAFRHSARTSYDMAQTIFACHMGGVDHPKTCAGFLLRGSTHNLLIRIATSMGKLDMSNVSDGGVPLYESYREMAEANGVDPYDPVLRPCRSNRY